MCRRNALDHHIWTRTLSGSIDHILCNVMNRTIDGLLSASRAAMGAGGIAASVGGIDGNHAMLGLNALAVIFATVAAHYARKPKTRKPRAARERRLPAIPPEPTK